MEFSEGRNTSGIVSNQYSEKDERENLVCKRSKERALRNPVLRALISAVDKQDCNFNAKRDISCHKCIPEVSAGFIAETNQIILCQNACLNERTVGVNLGHELIHVFDNCRAKVDFANINHLACTEVRAANIMHCRSKSVPARSDRHKDCVKARALRSVQLQSGVSLKKAQTAVDNVFEQCYNDLSPFLNNVHACPMLTRTARRNYTYY